MVIDNTTTLPKWLKPYLDEAGLARIRDAVVKAEATTCGEIVPVLVRRSTEQASTPVIGGLVMLVIALALHHAVLSFYPEWQHEIYWAIFMAVMTLSGFALGFWPPAQRLLIAHTDQTNETERRAMLAFYQTGVPQTQGKTGIMLFVSFFERKAVVLADDGIAAKTSNTTFQLVVQDLTKGARRGDLATGFEQAIARCGELLAPHFPRTALQTNQLKDNLHILD